MGAKLSRLFSRNAENDDTKQTKKVVKRFSLRSNKKPDELTKIDKNKSQTLPSRNLNALMANHENNVDETVAHFTESNEQSGEVFKPVAQNRLSRPPITPDTFKCNTKETLSDEVVASHSEPDSTRESDTQQSELMMAGDSASTVPTNLPGEGEKATTVDETQLEEITETIPGGIGKAENDIQSSAEIQSERSNEDVNNETVTTMKCESQSAVSASLPESESIPLITEAQSELTEVIPSEMEMKQVDVLGELDQQDVNVECTAKTVEITESRSAVLEISPQSDKPLFDGGTQLETVAQTITSETDVKQDDVQLSDEKLVQYDEQEGNVGHETETVEITSERCEVFATSPDSEKTVLDVEAQPEGVAQSMPTEIEMKGDASTTMINTEFNQLDIVTLQMPSECEKLLASVKVSTTSPLCDVEQQQQDVQQVPVMNDESSQPKENGQVESEPIVSCDLSYTLSAESPMVSEEVRTEAETQPDEVTTSMSAEIEPEKECIQTPTEKTSESTQPEECNLNKSVELEVTDTSVIESNEHVMKNDEEPNLEQTVPPPLSDIEQQQQQEMDPSVTEVAECDDLNSVRLENEAHIVNEARVLVTNVLQEAESKYRSSEVDTSNNDEDHVNMATDQGNESKCDTMNHLGDSNAVTDSPDLIKQGQGDDLSNSINTAINVNSE